MTINHLSGTDYLLAIGLGLIIALISEALAWRSKKAGDRLLILLALGGSLLFFWRYPLLSAILLICLGANVSFVVFNLTEGWEKYQELMERVRLPRMEEVPVERHFTRLAIDIALTLVLGAGLLAAVIFIPGEYSVLPMLSLFLLINLYGDLLRRVITFYKTSFYYDPEKGELLIVSPTQPRQLPLSDVESVQLESAPDILRLNPLLVFFSSVRVDYTVNLQPVLSLAFPGETIFLTVREREAWLERFSVHMAAGVLASAAERQTLPIWHPSVLKRLGCKLYYAVTIKGISAYAALVLLLYRLDLPPWLPALIILLWWLFNLYVSDRILASALDVEEIKEGEVAQVAQQLFIRAGLPHLRLYQTEAREYNGLAIGFNTGRAMVVLTSASLKLPLKAVEAILAHEVVHVKKRDILTGQIWRLLGIGLVILLIWLNFETLQYWAEAYTWLLLVLFAVLPELFLIYLSLGQQWMEVRADHVGSAYLAGGKKQMAEALRLLALHQDRDLDKSLSYSEVKSGEDNKEKLSSTAERDTWGWRFLEFQFLPHPPLYWRIHLLSTSSAKWGWALVKRWLRDRLLESLPDRLRRGWR